MTNDSMYSFNTDQLPFQIQDSILTLLTDSIVSTEYKKSKLDNTFDHKTHELGMTIDLPLGYSQLRLPTKSNYHWLYIDQNIDSTMSIIINDKKIKTNELRSKFLKISSQYSSLSNCVLAIDKNIPFKKYSQIYNSIIHKDSIYIRFYHSVRGKPNYVFGPSPPWIQVAYDRTGSLRFTSQISDLKTKNYTYISLSVDSNGRLLLNGKIIKQQNIYKKVLNLYSIDSAQKCFKIVETEHLTYGNYIHFVSMINKIVLDKRKHYSEKIYHKKLYELDNYNLAVEGSKALRDSLIHHVYSVYPNNVIIQD